MHLEVDRTDAQAVAIAIGALADRLRSATTRDPEVFLTALDDFCGAARALGVPTSTVLSVIEYHLASDAHVDTFTRVRARALADTYARSGS